MGLLRKVWTPGPYNSSRLHDEKGNRVDLGGLAYLPHCLVSTACRMLTGRRFAVPWLGYRAARTFARLLPQDSAILEFGSGMSTLWFAARAARVVSVESDPVWFDVVKAELTKRRLTNVDYRLRTTPEFADPPLCPDAAFDLVLVDGWLRAECAATAVRKVKPGGLVYLDNSDRAVHDQDIAAAELTLLAAAGTSGEVRYLTDFSPNFFVVHQGLMVRL